VRLPKDYRFQGSEVAVKHFGNGVLLLPVDDPWATLEAGLASFEPGFVAELAYGVAKGGSARNRQALEMLLAPLVIFPSMRPSSGPTAICGRTWNERAHRSVLWTP
jgi:virulence-associated protein VagC